MRSCRSVLATTRDTFPELQLPLWEVFDKGLRSPLRSLPNSFPPDPVAVPDIFGKDVTHGHGNSL